ncbi:MAG TPA: DivIVA domain-containing protein [Acidimicrobiales bacterium]|nr:DivIVA domain-containing protein [Acidimicrobiales bacterium]
MPEQNPPSTNSGRNLSPEDIANHSFPSARKGLDPEAVRRFLSEVATQVRDLRTEQAKYRASASPPRPSSTTPTASGTPIDEAELTRVLGEEMTRVLQTARESSHAIVFKAERQAAEIIAGAEKISQNRRTEAETSAVTSIEHARVEAAEFIEKTKNECRVMIEEARETRLRILADLADRRRTLLIQLEQVRVGKESMVAVVESVASTVSDSIDAVRAQLLGVEESSRIAADRAALELEAAIVAGEYVDALAEQTLAKIPAMDVPEALTEPEHHQVAPVKARVFDIEREAIARPVSVASVFPAGKSESSVSIPSFLKEDDAKESTSLRVPDSTPTVSQKPRTTITAERAPIQDAAPISEQQSPDRDAGTEVAHEEHPVDQLFAKIRASRESKVADAQRVLSHEAGTTPKSHAHSRRRTKEQTSSEVTLVPSVKDGQAVAELVTRSRASVASPAKVERESEMDVIEEPRQRRDRELEPAHLELSRSLKRVLREEQNLLLDALRNRKKNEAFASLLPGSAARERLTASATPGVSAAFDAGYGFLGKSSSKTKSDVALKESVQTVCGRVADEVLDALNSRLAPRFEKGSDEEGEISEIVGSAFREWKAARVEALSLDYAVDAFGAGEIAYARSKNMSLVWNLDGSGNGCPDCDDNGVAGKVIAGESFPTGHLHPPVHPGCRCFLSS